VIVIMGVAGSGKTTVGQMLAGRLRYAFADADDFHSPESKIKMATGAPLTDQDRQPWLQSMHEAIEKWLAARQRYVLACSALKRQYRSILHSGHQQVKFVYLKTSKALARRRLLARRMHYMKANMLESQFETLEEPDISEAIIIAAGQAPQEITRQIVLLLTNAGPIEER
jgi:gluconokinase